MMRRISSVHYIEIQRADKGASVKQARYNVSMMDANTLVKGEEYDKLPEYFCIFITEKMLCAMACPYAMHIRNRKISWGWYTYHLCKWSISRR